MRPGSVGTDGLGSFVDVGRFSRAPPGALAAKHAGSGRGCADGYSSQPSTIAEAEAAAVRRSAAARRKIISTSAPPDATYGVSYQLKQKPAAAAAVRPPANGLSKGRTAQERGRQPVTSAVTSAAPSSSPSPPAATPSRKPKRSPQSRRRTPGRTAAATMLELPLTLPCRGGCGFYGSSKTGGLCSKCSGKVDEAASRVCGGDMVKFLIQKCGYKNDAEVMHEIAFNRLFPNASPASINTAELPGVRSWQTTQAPVTQYDQVPLRGESACSFIAAVAALKLIWWKQCPGPTAWANAITVGVRAFHMCKAKTPIGEELHRNVIEVLEYVVPALGYSPDQVDGMRAAVEFNEQVVGLVVPEHITQPEYIEFLGPTAYHTIGVDGVVEALSSIFKSYGPDTEPDEGVAVVVIRPPETFCIVKNAGPEIYFRDSHRRDQFDFDTLATFLRWVRLHPSYFAPMPETEAVVGGSLHNQIGLYSITPTVRSEIADAIVGAGADRGTPFVTHV